MGIRLSGLNSGMDTDSIVQALMSAQRTKQTKIKGKSQKLEWKKEIWAELNTKVYNFYKGSLSKIKSQGAFKTKAATSSNTSKVTATATSSASEGTYKIKVNSLASAQYVTSDKLAGAKDENGNKVAVTSKTKLTDLLDKSGNTTFQNGTQISVKGTSGLRTVLVDENTTVSDFVTACKNAGLNASFDEAQQRFFIGSGTSGKDQGFTITAGTLDATQQQAVTDWKNAIGYSALSNTDKAAVDRIFDRLQNGEVAYADVESTLDSYVEKGQTAAVTADYRKTYTDSYNSLYFNSADGSVTPYGKAELVASGTKTQAQVDAMSDADLKSAVSSMVSTKVANDITANQTQINNDIAANVQAGKTTLDTVAANYQSTMSTVTGNSNAALSGLGMQEVTGAEVKEAADGTGMVVVAASDASITFNGATLTSSTSSLSVNGLTLEVLDKTDVGEEITISVTKDNSAIYDTIKDFISDYNAILKEMNTKYGAASARGYDVLTDDQKEAMSDDEVEKWNDKIKSSLLRRDSTLNTLVSSFRQNMMGAYTASDGKRYSLSSIGITTSTDYTEGGLLHIQGDEDDTEFADSTNKLEKMINDDPDLVMEIINGLAGNLYSDLQKKMQSTTMSSALTFYNDKEMNSQLSDYKKKISEWETKLAAMENRYYAQFTAMEKAMASLNSQQNYFSSLLG